MKNNYNILNHKKIAIFGWPATGKSTLSNILSLKLNIPCYSLDDLRWKNFKNNQKDDNAFLKEYNKIIVKDEWIIEGNALDWIDSRLENADLLIFFESDIDTCINNFIQREERIKSNKESRKAFSQKVDISIEDNINWIRNRYSKKIDKLRIVLLDYKDKLLVIKNYDELTDIIKLLES